MSEVIDNFYCADCMNATLLGDSMHIWKNVWVGRKGINNILKGPLY